MHRAAAERCEAGAEDHAGVEQFLVFDHVVAQAGQAFVQVGLDQVLRKLLEIVALVRLASRTGLPFSHL